MQYWYIDFFRANKQNLIVLLMFYYSAFLHCVCECACVCVCETRYFRWKQLPLNLYRDVLESLQASLQTVVCHALHVAVHTEPHVTPAAYPLAVQFNQADDMQHDIP